jgi:transcriptional regulator with XRE-family HTH domain
MSSKNKKDWDSLLAFENEEEKIDFISETLSGIIAHKIEQLLQDRKMSKKDLAHKIGTSPSYITQIMTGDKLVNMKLLAKIMYFLGVSIDLTITDPEKLECIITDVKENWKSSGKNKEQIWEMMPGNDIKAC